MTLKVGQLNLELSNTLINVEALYCQLHHICKYQIYQLIQQILSSGFKITKVIIKQQKYFANLLYNFYQNFTTTNFYVTKFIYNYIQQTSTLLVIEFYQYNTNFKVAYNINYFSCNRLGDNVDFIRNLIFCNQQPANFLLQYPTSIIIINMKEKPLFQDDDDDERRLDIIQQTRKAICSMTEAQRFQKAKRHLDDALAYRIPRPDTYRVDLNIVLRVVCNLQTSWYWGWILFILSYVYMYLVVLDKQNTYHTEFYIEISILFIYWADVILQVVRKSTETLRLYSKYQKKFYFRIVVLILLCLDEIFFMLYRQKLQRPIRPFRILRCFLPILYDSFIRKTIQALLSSYKDIIVYLVFYTIMIIGFAIVGNQIIQIPPGTNYDYYKQNYTELSKLIFVIYVLSSYDSYPDNQHIAIDASIYNYGFFILFIFFNVFFFIVIPSTIIFNSFRQVRSKILLIDEIKQKHSLILCFVSLGQANLYISHSKLVRFLLYVYKKKSTYVDYIAQICLKMDPNSMGQIQVTEFMQLCKILEANQCMLPPKFSDWQPWINFHRWLETQFNLKEKIQSKTFTLFTIIIIILTFINSCLFLVTKENVFDFMDDVFMAVFCLEIFIRILGLGFQNFFEDKWNNLDFYLVIIGLFLQLGPDSIVPPNSDILFKMTRILRITTLIKYIAQLPASKQKNTVYAKVRQLIGQITIIIPIVLKFFPIFMITYFILGIIGMEIFYGQTKIPENKSPYAFYGEYSNFHSFIGTQFIMVQILVEAGWSTIAYDHAYRFNAYYPVMLYFVMCHMFTVLVLSALMKGIVWEVYYTVHQEYQSRLSVYDAAQKYEIQIQNKKKQLEQIKENIHQLQMSYVESFFKKQLNQNKINQLIFLRLKEIYRQKLAKEGISKRNLSFNFTISCTDLQDNYHCLAHSNFNKTRGFCQLVKCDHGLVDDPADFKQEMQQILDKFVLSHKIRFTQSLIYPPGFIQFLQSKLEDPFERKHHFENFDLNQNTLASHESLNFLSYQLNVLLNIEISRKQQKESILKHLVHEGQGLIDEETFKFKKYGKVQQKGIDVNWIIRTMFLGSTNPDLIKKFQVQYFSDIYGKSFREINKITIQPLLKYQATLTYTLKNLLRYSGMKKQAFFEILATIQDNISNNLLKNGSLFKFVYKLDQLSDTWFSIKVNKNKPPAIHFIKSGIWSYLPNMASDKIYYGRDIFNWKNMFARKDYLLCEKYMKLFYSSFQTLGLCLLNEQNFFGSHPNNYYYDLYQFYLDTVKPGQIRINGLSISKIMVVILSKQQERAKNDKLPYLLTDLKIYEKKKKTFDFKFDQSQNETFKKLKKLAVMDQQKIVETQGLPFAFILNFLAQIKDTLTLHNQTLMQKVVKLLNNQFNGNQPQ